MFCAGYFLVYFCQKYLHNQMERQESHLRSILKGISWRFLATGTLILIVFFVEESIATALGIGSIEFFIKLFIYYGHERLWNVYLKGREQTARISLYKTIVWRFVASATTFCIAFFVLSSSGEEAGSKASMVVAIEFFAKFIIYYLHERAWQAVPLGAVRKIFGRKQQSKKQPPISH